MCVHAMDSRSPATDNKTSGPTTPPESIFCHGVVINGSLHRDTVIRHDPVSGRVSLTPFSRETHSTTIYDGAAIILPVDRRDIALPSSIPSATFTDTLSSLLPYIPHCSEDERCIIRLIPLS